VREIETAVRAVLLTRNVEGEVVVRDKSLELRQAGGVVSVELGEWVEQWAVIPPDMRDRRALACAVRLQEALAQVKSGSKAGGALGGRELASRAAVAKRRALPGTFGIDLDAKGVATLLAGVAVVGVAAWWFMFRVPESKVAVVDVEKSREAARVRRVCEAGRQQVYAGAAMAVDSAGWIVELWLAKERNGRFSATEIDEAVAAETVSKALGDVPLAEVSTTVDGRTAVLRFDGPYVAPFFSTSGRPLFVSLAARLTKRLGGQSAALYAKCAHLTTHDIGAWFWGKTTPQAATALLFASGLYAHPPAMEIKQLGEDPLAAVERRIRSLGPRALASSVTHAGGALRTREAMVDPDGLGGTAVRFPLAAATRAGRASRALIE
jgi:hypothetical protein